MPNISLMDISIKTPCHENWNEMTPNEQGAFCGKCVKTVVDFSNRSIEEIKAFFTTREEEKVCGRFEERQLTALSFDAFFEKFKRFEFTKRFALIVFFTCGFWLFGTGSISAQTGVNHIQGDVMVIETPVSKGNVTKTSKQKDSLNCAKPNPKAPKPKVMGKVAAPAPQKEPVKMGEVVAPPPKKPATPKK